MYDNTMILFMSDNGANGVMATTYPGNGDGKYLGSFNNSLKTEVYQIRLSRWDRVGRRHLLHLSGCLRALLRKVVLEHH